VRLDISFAGDARYTLASSSEAVTVLRRLSLLTLEPVAVNALDVFTATATLTDKVDTLAYAPGRNIIFHFAGSSLTAVTDAGGLTGSDSIAISVIGSSAEEILLSVKTYKVKNVKYADLAWSGTTAAETDVRRDGSIIATTANDGSYTDGPLDKSIKKATYQVCEAGKEACSNPVTVSW
jgi:hypothetical protein